MSGASRKSRRVISKATRNATSSRASASGVTHFIEPGFQTILGFGLDPVHANPSARPENRKAYLTSDISGPHGSDSSRRADQKSSSENKSQAQSAQGCKRCGASKDFSNLAKSGYKGNLRNLCKECRNSEQRERHENRRTSTRFRALRMLSAAKMRAKELHLLFDLDAEWIQDRLVMGRCEATGIAFDMELKRGWNTPSLDRIIPSKGYTKANTRVAIFALNTACGNWGEQPVLEIARGILARRKNASNALSKRLAENLKKRTDVLGSALFDLTWSELVTPSGHVIPQLQASARRTFANGLTLSVWPTPMAGAKGTENYNEAGNTDSGRKTVELVAWPTPNAMGGGQTSRGGDRKDEKLIGGLVQMVPWPTPTAHNGTGGVRTPEQIAQQRANGNGAAELTETVLLTTWPTPHVPNGGRIRKSQPEGSKRQLDIETAVLLTTWATPRAEDAESSGTRHSREIADTLTAQSRLTRDDQLPRQVQQTVFGATPCGSPAQTASTARLNPKFSLWLMGLPWDVWERCAALATLSLRQSRKRSLKA